MSAILLLYTFFKAFTTYHVGTLDYVSLASLKPHKHAYYWVSEIKSTNVKEHPVAYRSYKH